MKLIIFLSMSALMIASCSKSDGGGSSGGTGGVVHIASECPTEFSDAGPVRREGDTFYFDNVIIDGQEHDVPHYSGDITYRAGCSNGGFTVKATDHRNGKVTTKRAYRGEDGRLKIKEQ